MDDSAEKPKQTGASNWAKPVDRMHVESAPVGGMNLNVEGRRPTGPLQGFGQLWQKSYRLPLEGIEVKPDAVIAAWKENFASFWPKGNRFYGSMSGIQPGDVAVLNLSVPGGMKLSTGVRVIYADDESFSFMTPQGHMFAGMITFSAFEEQGVTYANIQVLIRASDPLIELTFRMGVGHKGEDQFWSDTLKNLAAHFGAGGDVTMTKVCVDKKVQWSEAKNIWHSAAIRTTLYMPVHMTRRLLGRA